MKIPRREFLQLADTYKPDKHDLRGHYISEKLDGTRCLWDGGVSRGKPTSSIPWASVLDPKTGKRKGKIKPIASGLWSRYGNPIMAPDWFLNLLPPFPLDGELWAGRGKFQLCRSICAGDKPDPRFDQISYAVYSAPSVSSLFQSGEIKNSNFICELNAVECVEFWLKNCMDPNICGPKPGATFDEELAYLQSSLETQSHIYLHRQTMLHGDWNGCRAQAEAFLADVLDKGGEGVVMRDRAGKWRPKRHKALLKYKPFEDDEAIVIGYVSGKEGKQGNVLGKIGALIVDWKGIEFELGSGLSFEDREFAQEKHSDIAKANPGKRIENVNGRVLKLGDKVTFKYRELTDDGIPKEARFWRRRDVE
jgi:DNA ligase-1